MKMLQRGKSWTLGVGEDGLFGIKGMLQALNNFIPNEKRNSLMFVTDEEK